MKKEYIKPEIKASKFSVENVVTTSMTASQLVGQEIASGGTVASATHTQSWDSMEVVDINK